MIKYRQSKAAASLVSTMEPMYHEQEMERVLAVIGVHGLHVRALEYFLGLPGVLRRREGAVGEHLKGRSTDTKIFSRWPGGR
jgi:hypothetical protein